MWCSLCRGFMTQDHCYDLLDESGHLSFTAWRCACCGNMVEEISTRPYNGNGEALRVKYPVWSGNGLDDRQLDWDRVEHGQEAHA